MQKGELHLTQHGMSEFRILLRKMRVLNINDTNDRLHPLNHFQTVDNDLSNTIAQNQDWFERMTQKKRRRQNREF